MTAQQNRYVIQVSNKQSQFDCAEGELLLPAMEKAGSHAIHVGCRKGGCGMCKVRVLEGHYQTLKMSRAHVSETEEQAGFVLACRTSPLTHLTIESDHFALLNKK